MSCDDHVEYMYFPCGLDVRVAWGVRKPPSPSLMDAIFSQVDNLHADRCPYCKEENESP